MCTSGHRQEWVGLTRGKQGGIYSKGGQQAVWVLKQKRPAVMLANALLVASVHATIAHV